MPRDVMPIMSDRDLARAMTDRSGGFGQGMGGPGPVEEPIEEPSSTLNIERLIGSSGEINPAGQFTEEYRVPANLADPSIAQGPVGWYPEDWHQLPKSEYPFIPSNLGGHYTNRGPEGAPSIVYNMQQTGMLQERGWEDEFQPHERFHDAGNTLSTNMGAWGDVKFDDKPLKDVMAPNDEWDRELFHMIIYSLSPNPVFAKRTLENYKDHPFFSDVKTDEDKLRKINRLVSAVDEAAGNVYNAFTQGTTPTSSPQWGEGAVGSYSSEQAIGHDHDAPLQGIIGR